jgi:hypothetical protein
MTVEIAIIPDDMAKEYDFCGGGGVVVGFVGDDVDDDDDTVVETGVVFVVAVVVVVVVNSNRDICCSNNNRVGLLSRIYIASFSMSYSPCTGRIKVVDKWMGGVMVEFCGYGI